LETPLRRFLRTETGSTAVLLGATLAALAWVNLDPGGYAAAWHTVLLILSGTRGLADTWQGWVNSGLMAFFFLVAGLEARREFDLGELRERPLVLPLVVALGGMVVPVAVYLAINVGRTTAAGWGAATSTDTAFALGVPALVGPGVPDRVPTYLLTFSLVDDVAGIVVIALAYSGHINLAALGAEPGHPRRGDRGPLAGDPVRPGLSAAGGRGLGGVLRIRRRPGSWTGPRRTRGAVRAHAPRAGSAAAGRLRPQQRGHRD